ncbi:hypothetical protein [Desulfosarcina ovata]|uniref:Uncharacterized protein n=1 Tax=Desulfosarcina ovata subsp. ovata TaxID=2752305 RepID=A0A5K8AE25_9BACT|nr:hypothetical protein [Desulfosarcina ovata]BBO90200.1 hypothetical protein DSCOOX_33800 [Desulfosarcina ovata subsp. ovata]
MVDSKSGYETDYRNITLKTIEGSTINGKVNISPNQRISDLLTLNESPFLVVVDANYGDFKEKVLFINKAYIVWIEPED